MKRETKAESAARIQGALGALRAAYPEVKAQLEFESPFELLVATILSAQCTDKQVNKATRVLFPLYNTPAAFVALGEEGLTPYIHSCGFYKTKGKHIIETCEILLAEYGGEVPADRDLLTKLPGVGRKTANVVISNAFRIPAIAVDTHVFRVANRIGITHAKDVRNTEKQLMENIPQADWSDAHHWLIYHGRQVCSARKPKCESCPVREYCLTYRSKENVCNS